MAIDFRCILTSFRQHGFGNCTSIGVIKAALEVYGIDGVFQSARMGPDLAVNLKDGTRLTLLGSELDAAQKYCGFQLLDPADPEKQAVLHAAELCFAVICKSKQTVEEYSAYQDAIDDVNNGESAFEAPRYLGLQGKTQPVRYAQVDGLGGIVAHSPHHTVYVSHGYFDDYGVLNRLDSIFEWARFGRGIYRFVP